jgi:hypothetical protein
VPKANPPQRLNVLFIGNSFTARNNVPGLIAELAAARGLRLDHRLISVGGASLGRHWNAGTARGAIETGGYHFVVLQEQSTRPIKGPKLMHESIRLFDGVIRAAGAQTVLYQTWARRHAPESQGAIIEAYATIGREIGARVAPVGQAWRHVLAQPDAPDLYDKDGSHPSRAGSYLAACVFLMVLFAVSPLPGNTIAARGALDVQELHNAAERAVATADNA